MPEASSKKTRKKSAKRAAILKAALSLFAERGFYGTPVPLIAERAGVGAGTIYRYFPSKEALVNALFQERKSAMLTALFEDFPWRSSVQDRFLTFWRRLALLAREDRDTVVFMELHHHAPYLDKESRALEARLLLPVFAFFEEGRAQGLMRDLEETVLLAMAWGAFLGLLKAVQLGALQLDDALIAASGQVAWAAVRNPDAESL